MHTVEFPSCHAQQNSSTKCSSAASNMPLDPILQCEQNGFRQSRGTVQHILVARLITEEFQTHGCPLILTYFVERPQTPFVNYKHLAYPGILRNPPRPCNCHCLTVCGHTCFCENSSGFIWHVCNLNWQATRRHSCTLPLCSRKGLRTEHSLSRR